MHWSGHQFFPAVVVAFSQGVFYRNRGGAGGARDGYRLLAAVRVCRSHRSHEKSGHTSIVGHKPWSHDYASEKISCKNGLFSSVFKRIKAMTHRDFKSVASAILPRYSFQAVGLRPRIARRAWVEHSSGAPLVRRGLRRGLFADLLGLSSGGGFR